MSATPDFPPTPSPRARRPWLCVWLAATVLCSPPAAAQWRVYDTAADSGNGGGEVATVTNASGDSLRVYRDPDGLVYGEFILRKGFHSLAPSTCPSYQIDFKRPLPLRHGRGGCEVAGRSARFVLGETGSSRVESVALLGLMNGTRLRFRFHLTGLGYQETEFSLRGSKQALLQAIGADPGLTRGDEPGQAVGDGPEDLLD